jgi:regulator of protease activity HflC (stomatin/prohibitin superfamily)
MEKKEKKGKISLLIKIGVNLILISPLIIGLIVGGVIHIVLDLLRIQIPLGWQIGLGILAGFAVLVRLLKEIIIRVPFGEAWIIDRQGEIRVAKPGYNIIIPFFSYERFRTKLNTRQYSIPLFPEMKEVWIDLSIGGEIRLHDPRIWIIIEDSLKAFTTAANFEEQLREMVENRLTGAVNAMTYEEIMELRVPRALVEREEVEAAKRKIKRKIDEIIEASEGIKKFLEEIGCKYKGFTLDDFDFDTATTQKRRERITTEMEKKVAKNIAEAKKIKFEIEAKATAAETVGTVIEMMAKARGKKAKEIQAEIETKPELQKEFLRLANDLIIRKMGIEGAAYVDIRVEGPPRAEGKTEGEGFLSGLIDKFAEAIIKIEAAKQRMPMGKLPERRLPGKKPREERKEKKRKPVSEMSDEEVIEEAERIAKELEEERG